MMKNALMVLATVFIVLGIQHFIIAPHHKMEATKQENVYDRVMRTGTIRCGYTPYSIGLMKDPNTGKLSGVYYDIITQLAHNLGLKAEWTEEVGWGEQIAGLNAGRYDMICSPVSLNAGRARAADFSIPLYGSPVHIWARKNDTAITDDMKTLDNPKVKIAVMDGEQTSVFAREFFPKAQEVSLPQMSPFSDLVMQVTSGKADIVFAEPLAIHEFEKTHPGSLRQVTPDGKPLITVPNIILLPRGQYEFKEMIDNGLREMFNAHLIGKAIDKYETWPGSYIRETGR
ncbi:MAG: transporter substrate-binding domain-containing protein [Alphaproteobacteria bacterium]|nr:transporter substrate-binding domain-containing protein [Alphaproteobacteria bacterium]